MAASGHFGSLICAKNSRILPLCVINDYARYEVDRWIFELETPQAFEHFIQNGRQRPFCFPIDAKYHRVIVSWDINGYDEYEFDWCICDKVMACASVGVRRWRRRRRRRRNQKHNTLDIFKFRGYNMIFVNSFIGGAWKPDSLDLDNSACISAQSVILSSCGSHTEFMWFLCKTLSDSYLRLLPVQSSGNCIKSDSVSFIAEWAMTGNMRERVRAVSPHEQSAHSWR